MNSEREQEFLRLWEVVAMPVPPGLPAPEAEYRFHEKRKWRFDFAWPDSMVAVEIEGGTFVRGRHTRGMGHHKDCEKYNQATLLGWRVLRFTALHLRDDPMAVIETVGELLKG